jgi:putative alpha-1,2-mannosidase
MSSWYVFNAIGIYPYSPADEDYIVSVPLFDEVKVQLDGSTFTIQKRNSGEKITEISYDGQKVEGYFVPHRDLVKGKDLVITTGN